MATGGRGGGWHDKLIPHHKSVGPDGGTVCGVCGEAWPCEHMRQAGAKRAGTLNGRAKLTPGQVEGIRDLHKTGALSGHAIARILGLNPTTVMDAINKTNWKGT